MLFQSLNKIKRSSIIMSMTLMALGLMMMICPKEYTGSLISAMGYGMLILTVVMILDYLDSKKVLMNAILLGVAILIGLLGLAVLVFRNDVLQILKWTFGILLIGQGIEHLYNAFMYVKPSERKGWWFLAILAVVLIGAGVFILINREWTTDTKKMLWGIGLTLLIDAAVGIIWLIWIWPIKEN